MIFELKLRWQTALLATIVLGYLSWLAFGWQGFGEGRLPVSGQILLGVLAAAFAIMVDGALHGLFGWRLGEGYHSDFRAHGAVICRRMGPAEVFTGGLMAGLAEEPLFRGVLLPSLLPFVENRAGIAIAVTSLLFAACHWIGRRFFLFWLWALWEGVLFGLLYVATESLIAPMVAHAIHDWIGYAMFRWWYCLHDVEG